MNILDIDNAFSALGEKMTEEKLTLVNHNVTSGFLLSLSQCFFFVFSVDL